MLCASPPHSPYSISSLISLERGQSLWNNYSCFKIYVSFMNARFRVNDPVLLIALLLTLISWRQYHNDLHCMILGIHVTVWNVVGVLRDISWTCYLFYCNLTLKMVGFADSRLNIWRRSSRLVNYARDLLWAKSIITFDLTSFHMAFIMVLEIHS